MRPVEPPKEEEFPIETSEPEDVEAKDEQAQEADIKAPDTLPPPPEPQHAPVVLGQINKNTGPRKLTKNRNRNLPSGKTKFVEGVD